MAKKKTIQPKLRFKNEEGKDYPDWEEKTLEEMCSNFKSGINITSKDIAEKGLYPVYGGNGLRGYSNSYTHEGFFVLIGRQGALCGNINRANGKAYISEHAIAVQANEENDTEWLAQKLQLMNLNRLSESSAQPGLAVGKLLKLKVFAPSLEEQKKIAEFLSAIDDKIENLEKELEELKAYKKGVMQAIFAAASDATERRSDGATERRLKIEALQDTKKHGFFIRFKDENGEDYPDWVEETLGELGEFKNGLNKAKEDFGFGFPFVNLMDVFGKTSIEHGDFDLVNATEKEIELYNLKKGDVLFIRSSVKREGVGEAAVILEDLVETVYSGFLIRFRENEGKEIDVYFKRYLFNNPVFRSQLLSYSTTSANTNINQDSLSLLKVKIPINSEQKKIGNFLSSIDEKINYTIHQIQNTRQYKQALLQQLLN